MAEDIVTRLREDSVFIEDALLHDAADEIERLRAMVDWLIDDRLWDFEDHPEDGPILAYDGIIGTEPLPDDIVQAFRKAQRIEEERIRQAHAEAVRRAAASVPPIAEAIERGMTVAEIEEADRG